MPSVRRSRTISAQPQWLWDVVRDPHHLPRWWPRVSGVESVEGDTFTEVLRTAKGRAVRADFVLAEVDEQALRLTWEQRLEGTPFARVIRSARTEVELTQAAGEQRTQVTIVLHQSLAGVSARLGSFLIRRAGAATLEEALNGLERIAG